MTEVLHCGGGEGALGAFEVQPVGTQHIEDSTEVLKVLGQQLVVDEDIVEEHKDPSVQ